MAFFDRLRKLIVKDIVMYHYAVIRPVDDQNQFTDPSTDLHLPVSFWVTNKNSQNLNNHNSLKNFQF